MLEGLSSKSNFQAAVAYIYQHGRIAEQLNSVITDLTIEYALQQINHGIEVFQLFETHGGILPFDLYETLFYPSIKRIARAVRDRGIPFIYFPKDIGTGLQSITPELCDVVSIDWQTPIKEARRLVHPEVGLQGNLDPRLLFADQGTIKDALEKYLVFGRNERNWIFNLGHGFIQGTRFENARFVVDWVNTVDWRNV
jgi:uroporphyrinogen decarboxylase